MKSSPQILYTSNISRNLNIFFIVISITISLAFIEILWRPFATSDNPSELILEPQKNITQISLPATTTQISPTEDIKTNNFILEKKNLPESFDQLVASARKGNKEVAYTLSQKLNLCAKPIALTHMGEDYATETKNQNHFVTQRNIECSSFSPLQLGLAAEMLKIAADLGQREAMLDYGKEIFSKMQNAHEEYLTQVPDAKRNPQMEDPSGMMKMLETIAKEGNIEALGLLAQINSSDSIIDINREKFLTYITVINHDWKKQSNEISVDPSGDDELDARVLSKSKELYEQCCSQKIKFEKL